MTQLSSDIGRIADLLAQAARVGRHRIAPSELERSRRDQRSKPTGPDRRSGSPPERCPSCSANRFSPSVCRFTPMKSSARRGPRRSVASHKRGTDRPPQRCRRRSGRAEDRAAGRRGRVRSPRTGRPDVPELAIGEPVPSVLVETDPAVASDVVQLMRIAPPAGPVVDEAAMRARLVERVAIEAMNRRL